jgi:hypothetical protein
VFGQHTLRVGPAGGRMATGRKLLTRAIQNLPATYSVAAADLENYCTGYLNAMTVLNTNHEKDGKLSCEQYY